jgi:hypothetical protein
MKTTGLFRRNLPRFLIGVATQFTDGFMMDPEASVSALVFHHPNYTYFGVGGND